MLPAGMTPSAKDTVAVLGVAVNVPPQEFVAAGDAAIIRGVGKLSVRSTPV